MNEGRNTVTNQTDLLKLQRQVDDLQSRMDFHSCQLQALWGVFRSLPEGEQILLRIQRDARDLFQTMELEEMYAR